ncbi:M15 family metallopeptidase [Clostridium saccharoperbutylacetonicum]
MKQDLLILMLAYPENISGVEKKSNDEVYLVMKSGKKIRYDDKRQKNHEEKLSDPDLQDMLEQYYPFEKTNEIMDKSFDPGRARNYALLSEVYGSSKTAIQKNLTNIKCGYTNYQFNSKNNANKALEESLKELISLARNRNDIASIIYPASGTFNYRVISGTGRLSPHSYGIAIDLKSDRKDYWKWSSIEDGKKRLAEYPKELVDVFEKNNFVWGGKWGHFDILHFEYRPEIILKARYFGNWDNESDWYKGVPIDENTSKYIELIDNTLK